MDARGNVQFDGGYGNVSVKGLTLEEAEKVIGGQLEWTAGIGADPPVSVTLSGWKRRYHPEHLAHVAQFGEQADALVFGYSLLYEDGPANGRPTAWDSAAARDDFFVTDIIAPLGVAHRRELWEKIGGFNELCCSSDWDFWKRPVAHRQFALLEWGTTRRLR